MDQLNSLTDENNDQLLRKYLSSSISDFSMKMRADLYKLLLNQITTNSVIIKDSNDIKEIELLLQLIYDDLIENDLDMLTKVIPILSWIMSCVWIIEHSQFNNDDDNNNNNNNKDCNMESNYINLVNSKILIDCINKLFEIFEKQCYFFDENILSLNELDIIINETNFKLLTGILFLVANQSLPNMIYTHIDRIIISINVVINKVIDISGNNKTLLYKKSINNISFNIFWLFNTIIKQNLDSDIFSLNKIKCDNIKKLIYIISLYLSNKANENSLILFDINQEKRNEMNTLQVIHLIQDYFNNLYKFQCSDNDSSLYQIYNDLLESIKSYTISLIRSLNYILKQLENIKTTKKEQNNNYDDTNNTSISFVSKRLRLWLLIIYKFLSIHQFYSPLVNKLNNPLDWLVTLFCPLDGTLGIISESLQSIKQKSVLEFSICIKSIVLILSNIPSLFLENIQNHSNQPCKNIIRFFFKSIYLVLNSKKNSKQSIIEIGYVLEIICRLSWKYKNLLLITKDADVKEKQTPALHRLVLDLLSLNSHLNLTSPVGKGISSDTASYTNNSSTLSFDTPLKGKKSNISNIDYILIGIRATTSLLDGAASLLSSNDINHYVDNAISISSKKENIDVKVDHEMSTNSISLSTPTHTPSKIYSSPFSNPNMKDNTDDYILTIFPELNNTLIEGNILNFSYLNPCSFNFKNQIINNVGCNSFASQNVFKLGLFAQHASDPFIFQSFESTDVIFNLTCIKKCFCLILDIKDLDILNSSNFYLDHVKLLRKAWQIGINAIGRNIKRKEKRKQEVNSNILSQFSQDFIQTCDEGNHSVLCKIDNEIELMNNTIFQLFLELWCEFWCSSYGITLVEERQLFLESLWWILHRFSAFNITPTFISETSNLSCLQKETYHAVSNNNTSFLSKIFASTLLRDSKWDICLTNCPENMAGVVMLMTLSHARLINCYTIESNSSLQVSLDLIHWAMSRSKKSMFEASTFNGLLTWLSTLLRSSPRYCSSISDYINVSIPDSDNMISSIVVMDKGSNQSEPIDDIYVTSIISEFIVHATSVIVKLVDEDDVSDENEDNCFKITLGIGHILNCPLLLISTGHEGIRKFIYKTESQSSSIMSTSNNLLSNQSSLSIFNDFLFNWSKIFKTWLITAENWLKSRLIPPSSSSSMHELTPITSLYLMNSPLNTNSQFVPGFSGNTTSSQDISLLAFNGLPLSPIRGQNLLYYIYKNNRCCFDKKSFKSYHEDLISSLEFIKAASQLLTRYHETVTNSFIYDIVAGNICDLFISILIRWSNVILYMDTNLISKTSMPLLAVLIDKDASLVPLLVELTLFSKSSLKSPRNTLITNKVTIYNINKQLDTRFTKTIFDRIILIVSTLLDCSFHHLFASKMDSNEEYNNDSENVLEFSTNSFNFSMQLYSILNQKLFKKDSDHFKKIIIDYIIIVIPKINSKFNDKYKDKNEEFINLLKKYYKEIEKKEWNNETISTLINLSDEKGTNSNVVSDENNKIIYSSHKNDKKIISNNDIDDDNNNNEVQDDEDYSDNTLEKIKPIFQTSNKILSLEQHSIFEDVIPLSNTFVPPSLDKIKDENNNNLIISNLNKNDKNMIIDNNDDDEKDIKKRKIEDSSIELIATANNYIGNLNINSPIMTENNKKLKVAILANIKTSLDLLKILQRGDDS